MHSVSTKCDMKIVISPIMIHMGAIVLTIRQIYIHPCTYSYDILTPDTRSSDLNLEAGPKPTKGIYRFGLVELDESRAYR